MALNEPYSTREKLGFEAQLAYEQHVKEKVEKAAQVAGTFAAGAQAVRDQVEQERGNQKKGKKKSIAGIRAGQGVGHPDLFGGYNMGLGRSPFRR